MEYYQNIASNEKKQKCLSANLRKEIRLERRQKRKENDDRYRNKEEYSLLQEEANIFLELEILKQEIRLKRILRRKENDDRYRNKEEYTLLQKEANIFLELEMPRETLLRDNGTQTTKIIFNYYKNKGKILVQPKKIKHFPLEHETPRFFVMKDKKTQTSKMLNNDEKGLQNTMQWYRRAIDREQRELDSLKPVHLQHFNVYGIRELFNMEKQIITNNGGYIDIDEMLAVTKRRKSEKRWRSTPLFEKDHDSHDQSKWDVERQMFMCDGDMLRCLFDEPLLFKTWD